MCSAQKYQRQHFSEHSDTRTMKIGSGGWAGHDLREGDVSNLISVERCSASTARLILTNSVRQVCDKCLLVLVHLVTQIR